MSLQNCKSSFKSSSLGEEEEGKEERVPYIFCKTCKATDPYSSSPEGFSVRMKFGTNKQTNLKLKGPVGGTLVTGMLLSVSFNLSYSFIIRQI